MHRHLAPLLAGLLLATAAFAATTIIETQAPTQPLPTDAGLGISLDGARGFWLRIEAVQPTDGGVVVLDGVGTMLASDLNPSTGRWLPAPDANKSVTASGAGAYGQSWYETEMAVMTAGRRTEYTASGLTFDGGYTLPDGGRQIRVYMTTCKVGTTGC